MRKVGEILKNTRASRTLQFKKKWLNEGFTQISNRLLRDNTVSGGAKIMYLLLMSRCFRKDYAYPGVETLAKEIGVTRRTISTYKRELVKKKWIGVKRRGQGKTDIIFLLKY